MARFVCNLLSDESRLLIIIKLTGCSHGLFQQLGFLKPPRSSQCMFRFTITHMRSSCLKINGAVCLRLRPSLKTFLRPRTHTDQRCLWSGSFGRGEAVCLRRWWTSWWEVKSEHQCQRQLLDVRPGGNIHKSSHWSCWPPARTRGVRDMLIFCSYTPSVLWKHKGFLLIIC